MKKEILAAEQKRIDQVEQEIAKQIDETTTKLDRALSERKRVESTYSDTAKVNLAEIDDAMETNAAIQQQKQLVALAVENETILTAKDKNLKLLQKSPYFGRIDITEDGEHETLYIGTSSLISDDDEFLVYDWRAPISSLYYNGQLGPASYQTPMGQIDVSLDLKRQFKIENQKIVKMFDTNETIEDDILQDVLSGESDTHMQNIVATIQRAQNEIIKNVDAQLLVVQGVAGSGKTSAILQRIAYLLYHSKSDLTADQILLFSPNNLFSNYISEVLPSLGEKNMRQVTLHDFLTRRHDGFVIQTLFERFERDQNQLPSATKQVREFKESVEFGQLMREFLASKNVSNSLPFADLYANGEVIITQQEIADIFADTSANSSLKNRLHETKQELGRLFKQKVRQYAHTKQIEAKIENLSDQQLSSLLGDKVNTFATFEAEYQYLSQKLAARELDGLKDAIINDYFYDIYQLYLGFLRQVDQPNLNQKAYLESINLTAEDIEKHHLTIVDAVAILYLRGLLDQSTQNYFMKYLFIDEMQDYSPLFLDYLQLSFPKARLTLLGDQEQNIFEPDTNKNDVKTRYQSIFPNKKLTYHELNTSYRSTKPITDFGKAIINHPEITSFNRDGKKPEIKQFSDYATMLDQYPNLINAELKNNKIVAIITKTGQEAQFLFDNLSKDLPKNLITEKTRSLKHGVLIVPIYLAKGLEFDSVIAHDISSANYNSPHDREIIYTIASRAMHSLTITTTDFSDTFLAQLPPNLFMLK